jgi:hypothetical protein
MLLCTRILGLRGLQGFVARALLLVGALAVASALVQEFRATMEPGAAVAVRGPRAG